MKHELREMMRAYDTYLDKVSRFIEATDESERYKLIAFDVIERQSIDLEENLEAAYETLTQYLEERGESSAIDRMYMSDEWVQAQRDERG